MSASASSSSAPASLQSTPTQPAERAAVLALAAAAVQTPIEPSSPWSWASRLIEMGGSAQHLIERNPAATLLHQADWPDAEQLARGVTPELIQRCTRLVRSLPPGQARLVTVLDDDYPPALRLAWDRPPYVFVHGMLDRGPAVGIAGRWNPDAEGAEPTTRARALAGALARQHITVVAELSSSIGAAAIDEALQAGGPVIAVADRGLDLVGQEQAGAPTLQRLLAADRGGLVSPCWPDAISDPVSREQCDVLVSGLGVGLLVVDGDQHDRVWVQADRCLGHAKHLFIPRQQLCREPWSTYYGDHPGVTVVDTVDDILEVVAAMTAPCRNTSTRS